MTIPPPDETPNLATVSSADGSTTHVLPEVECFALPLAWEKLPLKPRVVPVRIWPTPGALSLATQPTAFRRFGINE